MPAGVDFVCVFSFIAALGTKCESNFVSRATTTACYALCNDSRKTLREQCLVKVLPCGVACGCHYSTFKAIGWDGETISIWQEECKYVQMKYKVVMHS